MTGPQEPTDAELLAMLKKWRVSITASPDFRKKVIAKARKQGITLSQDPPTYTTED